MTDPAFQRTELLLGEVAMARLWAAHVLVVGLGGVGGHCAEALARSGIGRLTLIDGDVVSESNLNRQLVATRDVLGQPKAQVLANRIALIHPGIQVMPVVDCFLPTSPAAILDGVDYVVDAVDMMTAKLELATRCTERNIPIIAAMGAGNKLDPSAFRVGDLFETRNDPLARIMRKELRKRGITKLQVVYSTEMPMNVSINDGQKRLPGSVAFVPSVAGLMMAGVVVRKIAGG